MVMISVSASATLIALQIPLIPNQIGSVSTMITWNTNVLRNEMTADIRPLFNAVKNDDPKILIPMIRNAMAYTRKPCSVIAYRPAL